MCLMSHACYCISDQICIMHLINKHGNWFNGNWCLLSKKNGNWCQPKTEQFINLYVQMAHHKFKPPSSLNNNILMVSGNFFVPSIQIKMVLPHMEFIIMSFIKKNASHLKNHETELWISKSTSQITYNNFLFLSFRGIMFFWIWKDISIAQTHPGKTIDICGITKSGAWSKNSR